MYLFIYLFTGIDRIYALREATTTPQKISTVEKIFFEKVEVAKILKIWNLKNKAF